MKHIVSISGCDASTIFAIDLDKREAATLTRLAAASTAASEYGCMPTIKFDAYDSPAFQYERETIEDNEREKAEASA